MNRYKQKVSVVDYFYIVLLLFSTLSVCYTMRNFALSIFCFLGFSVWRFLLKRLPGTNQGSLWYILIFCIAILFNRFLLYPDVDSLSWLEAILLAIASYCFFSSYDFEKFRKALLNTMFILTLANIVVFILDAGGALSATYKQYGETTWRMIGGVFVTGRDDAWERLSGIWHEPGAFQIFLNSVLLLYIPFLVKRQVSQFDILKLIVLIVGVVLTFSTTGYIVLALLIVYWGYLEVRYASWLMKCLAMIGMPILVYIIAYAPAITEKFEQDRSAEAETSLAIRERDNLACLAMALDHPFTGYGYNSEEFLEASMALDNQTSSNGLLRMSAVLGIWWLVLYLLFLWQFFRKMHFPAYLFPMVAVILMQANEAYVQYPISYMFLIPLLGTSIRKDIAVK